MLYRSCPTTSRPLTPFRVGLILRRAPNCECYRKIKAAHEAVGLELVAWYKSSAVLLHQFFFIGFRSSFKSNSLPRRGKRFRMYDYYGLQGRKYQALNRRRHRATPTAFCHVLLSSHPLAHIGLTLRNRRYGSIPCNKPILLYSIIQFRSILYIPSYPTLFPK